MERTGTNMFNVCKELRIDGIHLKIEKRSLERIGHLLRMDNQKSGPQANSGGQRQGSQTTNNYWMKLLTDAAHHPDTIEILALNREAYKTFLSQ